MNLTERAAKGDKAEMLLSNEIFSEAMSNLRTAIVQKWSECPVRDKEAQHELKLMMKLLGDLEANIRVFVTDGKKARFELVEQRKREALKRKTQRFM